MFKQNPSATLAAFAFLFISFISLLTDATPATDLFDRDIAHASRTLTRDIKLYNYFGIPQVYWSFGTRSGRDEYVDRYVASVIDRFWNPEYHDQYAINSGPGLYFAIDPDISRSFGNSMIEIHVPAQTRYITVVQPQPIQDETVDALVNEGYVTSLEVPQLFVPAPKVKARKPKKGVKAQPAPSQAKWAFYRDTLKHMVAPGHDRFRQLVQNTLSQQNIQFIEYNWNTSLTGFCRNNSYSAFVYIAQNPYSTAPRAPASLSSAPLLFSELALPQLDPDEADLSRRVQILRTTLASISLAAKTQTKTDYTALILQSFTPTEYLEIANHLYSCEARNVEKAGVQ